MTWCASCSSTVQENLSPVVLLLLQVAQVPTASLPGMDLPGRHWAVVSTTLFLHWLKIGTGISLQQATSRNPAQKPCSAWLFGMAAAGRRSGPASSATWCATWPLTTRATSTRAAGLPLPVLQLPLASPAGTVVYGAGLGVVSAATTTSSMHWQWMVPTSTQPARSARPAQILSIISPSGTAANGIRWAVD